MNPQEQPLRRKHKKGSKGLLYIIVLITLCGSATGLTWLYTQGDSLQSPPSQQTNDQSAVVASENNTPDNIAAKQNALISEPEGQKSAAPEDDTNRTDSDQVMSQGSLESLDDSATQAAMVPEESNIALNAAAPPLLSQCEQSSEIVRQFFDHLDEQQYIRNYLGENKSEPYFINLIQKLVDNPPVVSRETDDLFTILKNTAHFFRILGSDNILILKAILHEEKPQVEEVLAQFYKLSLEDGCANNQFGLNLTKESLYDYAGFFLHTMGGRLYLFRRDSASRLTVSYYSILLIENANREGRNLHGIDIKPPLKLLIPEIENNGSQLLMRDTYLEKLYELENRLF